MNPPRLMGIAATRQTGDGWHWSLRCADAFLIEHPDAIARRGRKPMRDGSDSRFQCQYVLRYDVGEVVLAVGADTRRGALSRLAALVRATLRKEDWVKSCRL